MSKLFNFAKGRKGESKAAAYLRRKGYKILERNFTCPVGEIDIIARDKDILVFVEVKSRANNDYGTPAQAVNAHKQGKIIQVAKYYLVIKGIVNTMCRFDCVEITDGIVNHIECAFTR